MHSVTCEQARTVVGLLVSVADELNNPNPLTDLIRVISISGLPMLLGLDPCPAGWLRGCIVLNRSAALTIMVISGSSSD